MSRVAIRKASLFVILLACMFVTAGCPEIKRLEAENRRLMERNETLQQKLDRLRAEEGGAKKLQSQLDAKDKSLADLQADIDKKKEAILAQAALIKKLQERGPVSLPPKLNQALIDFAKANPQIAEFNPDFGMVKFKSDLTFPPGGTAVTAEAQAALGKLVEILKTDDGKAFAVYIAGHTDDMRIGNPETLRRHPTNWYLSAHRAISVQQVIEKAGMDPKRIAAVGFGEYHPVAPNKPNKKGNAANRRVEIWIVPAGQFLTTDAK